MRRGKASPRADESENRQHGDGRFERRVPFSAETASRSRHWCHLPIYGASSAESATRVARYFVRIRQESFQILFS